MNHTLRNSNFFPTPHTLPPPPPLIKLFKKSPSLLFTTGEGGGLNAFKLEQSRTTLKVGLQETLQKDISSIYFLLTLTEPINKN
jgi:hypothetical protein